MVMSLIESSAVNPGVASLSIAERFSAAANSYQQHNPLQRLSASRLVAGLTAKGRLLDIGAGPGTCFSAAKGAHIAIDNPASAIAAPALTVFALDIALGMLQKLQQNYPDYQRVCADAEQLPFGDRTMDCIYSNLALQWCADFPLAIAEMARVLKPQGTCHLAIVADGSLPQLSALGLRVNGFATMESMLTSFDPKQWQLYDCALVPMTVHFDSLKALLYSIKGVGASVPSPATAHGHAAPHRLRGRRDWRALTEDAEGLRQAQGLPLSYQIVQIRARRLAE